MESSPKIFGGIDIPEDKNTDKYINKQKNFEEKEDDDSINYQILNGSAIFVFTLLMVIYNSVIISEIFAYIPQNNKNTNDTDLIYELTQNANFKPVSFVQIMLGSLLCIFLVVGFYYYKKYKFVYIALYILYMEIVFIFLFWIITITEICLFGYTIEIVNINITFSSFYTLFVIMYFCMIIKMCNVYKNQQQNEIKNSILENKLIDSNKKIKEENDSFVCNQSITSQNSSFINEKSINSHPSPVSQSFTVSPAQKPLSFVQSPNLKPEKTVNPLLDYNCIDEL